MNNIKSFDEYSGYELEVVAYENVLNEGSIMGKGIRGFFNKKAASKVRAELEEEIEMSKSIMQGIQDGLETLNKNFDGIRKEISEGDNDPKGEKQKALDDILKIIEDSRKRTWDINELIDEGEIDYAGFTANIGIASVAYFGILLTPFRAVVMIHKGYNYFFNIIKNTIRKALVMLQLNFDQFENLIIAKGFQSADYLEDIDASRKLAEMLGAITTKLFDEKTGMIKNKQKANQFKQALDTAVKATKVQMEQSKQVKQSQYAYNNLDQYNNTYTKSLEALRQYSSDDVQKNLDAIKNSMNKLAGQEVDLQTYAELIIAAAEEHAYKVSSSIYNKFAKMTEVFNLPNQKKLIDLIEAATKEQMESAEKQAKELENKKELKAAEESADKLEEDGTEVFGLDLGEYDKEKGKYEKEDTVDAKDWTYDKYKELSDDDKDTLVAWLQKHPDILKKCDNSLRAVVYTSFEDGYFEYVNSLLDYVKPCIEEVKNESYIMDYESYLIEEGRKEDEDKWNKKLANAKNSEILWNTITHKCNSDGQLIDKDDNVVDIDKDDYEEKLVSININSQKVKKEIDYMVKKLDAKIGAIDEIPEDEIGESDKEKKKTYSTWRGILNKRLAEIKDELAKKGEKTKKDKSKKSSLEDKKIYIDFGKLKNESQIDYLTEIYKDTDASYAAYECIGNELLKNSTFVKNHKEIVDVINSALDSKSKKIEVKSVLTARLILDAIKKLDVLRSMDYVTTNDSKSDEKKSEE